MTPESLKRIIGMFNSTSKAEPDMGFVRIQNARTGMRVFTYGHQSVCNVFIPNETVGKDCMVSIEDKDFLTALHKKYKKTDVPVSEFLEIAVEYKQPKYQLDALMSETNSLQKESSFTVDFKELEKLYKSMKQKSNNIRIDVTTENGALMISNEEGDVSILSRVNS